MVAFNVEQERGKLFGDPSVAGTIEVLLVQHTLEVFGEFYKHEIVGS